ncbi:MAG: hypothetical protein GSR79_05345 [Desulfurococcales archaeon]|nr:hypothetical protein [Desulfurococcales archaeon]
MKNSHVHLIYVTALVISLLGSYIASQFDAPYGTEAAAESMLHSFSGWLILYPLVFIALYKRRGVILSALSFTIGVVVAAYNYNLYVEIINGYATSIPSRLEYIAQAPLMFVLTVAMGVFMIPVIVLDKIVSMIH